MRSPFSSICQRIKWCQVANKHIAAYIKLHRQSKSCQRIKGRFMMSYLTQKSSLSPLTSVLSVLWCCGQGWQGFRWISLGYNLSHVLYYQRGNEQLISNLNRGKKYTALTQPYKVRSGIFRCQRPKGIALGAGGACLQIVPQHGTCGPEGLHQS